MHGHRRSDRAGRAVKELRAMETYENQKKMFQIQL